MSGGMPRVKLAGTQLSVSRLIFGTASLFNVGSKIHRRALLEQAVASGFSHFDTAPYYGFGWAERDLGALLRSHPNITITTKVGIYSPGGEDSSRAAVLFRKTAGKIFASISRPEIDFSLARAKKMLEGSLSRLGCESIALYLLHEPELYMVATDEWQRWLETEVARGRVGAFGLASTKDRLLPFLESTSGLISVIQMLDSLDRREADCLIERGKPLQVTYGYVSAFRQRSSRTFNIKEVLSAALNRNSLGAVIVSTTKAERLGQYSDLLKSIQ